MAKLRMQKVPVTRRALIQRLNRKLAGDLVLKSTRGRGPQRWFLLNLKTNAVEFIEPEAYARKIGSLGAWEEVIG